MSDRTGMFGHGPIPAEALAGRNLRATMTIYAAPTRAEVVQWANSALRNSSIEYIDDALIVDFKDGLPALRAAPEPGIADTWQIALSIVAEARSKQGSGPVFAALNDLLGELDDARRRSIQR